MGERKKERMAMGEREEIIDLRRREKREWREKG